MSDAALHAPPEPFTSAIAILGDAIQLKHGINPCHNSAESYANSKFRMAAYDWSKQREWNFVWRDVVVSWYKYNGRCMSCNMALTTQDAIDMLLECLPSVTEGSQA